jgi:hypothetical protein
MTEWQANDSAGNKTVMLQMDKREIKKLKQAYAGK